MATTYPSVDQNLTGQFPTLPSNWYSALPVYFAAFQTERSKRRRIFQDLVPGRFDWEPNMGPVMKRIAQEMPPMIRQSANPRFVQNTPLYDITATRERAHEVYVHRQRFRSAIFNFLPEWRDFKPHIDVNLAAVQDLVDDYYDLFLRTRMIAYAPYVYVCGVGLVANCPTGGDTDANGNWTPKKTATWWQSLTSNPAATTLSFAEVFKALNFAEGRCSMTPYSGSGLPSGNSSPLDSKFCLAVSPERWNQFVDDPWLKENRPLSMNIVNEQYRGDLFGRVTCRLEKFALRFLQAANGSLTEPAPEEWSIDPDRPENGNRPQQTEDYAINSQWEVSLLLGGKFGSRMNVGAPPSAFTGTLNAIKGMNWNGKAYMTNQFIVPALDSGGNVVNELASQWGENLIIQAQLAMGYAPDNAWNVLPIFGKRATGITTSGATP